MAFARAIKSAFRKEANSETAAASVGAAELAEPGFAFKVPGSANDPTGLQEL
jgi:hypothetical protein